MPGALESAQAKICLLFRIQFVWVWGSLGFSACSSVSGGLEGNLVQGSFVYGQTMTEAEHNPPIPKLFDNRPTAWPLKFIVK